MQKVLVVVALSDQEIDAINCHCPKLLRLIKEGFRQGHVAFPLPLTGPADYIELHKSLTGCVCGNFGFDAAKHWCIVAANKDALDLYAASANHVP